jgi:uncharacterized protein DUF6159
MSFSTRVRTSWQLLECSVRVLREQPRLLLFPAISFVCLMVVALFFLSPILLVVFGAGLPARDWSGAAEEHRLLFSAYGVAIYLVAMFVGTFFNVALYHEALGAFAGRPVSLRRGWEFALSRIGAILCWSLLAGSVGLVIRSIEERLGWLGKIVTGLVGTAWSVAAVFAIPVIIRRADHNPLAVLRDSAVMLKQTWGEALVGFVGLQLAGMLLMGGMFIALLTSVVLALILHLGWFPLVVLVGGVLTMVVAGVGLAVATDIYRCALYVYSSEGVVPAPYTTELMDAGWKVRKR